MADYYGVEWNPRFTALLKTTEDKAQSNEHASPSGPVRSFPDRDSGDQPGRPDAALSRHGQPQGELLGIQRHGYPPRRPSQPQNVMGVTLTSLLQKAVKPGGHVIVKIGI